MKLLAICTFVVCAFITSCTASSGWGATENERKEMIAPQTRVFLLIFFGSASLVVPIVIAMPRSIARKPSGESVPSSEDSK